jgi:hypothetical protein
MTELNCPKCGNPLLQRDRYSHDSHYNIPSSLFEDHIALQCRNCSVYCYYVLLPNGELYNYQGLIDWVLVRQKKRRDSVTHRRL